MERQAADAAEHAARRGYNLPMRRIFKEAASGTSYSRAGFWDLLKCIDAGEIRVLLVAEATRLGSNDIDGALLLTKCRERKVRIELVGTGGAFLLQNPYEKFSFRINVAASDLRRDIILVNTKSTKARNGPQGYWMHGMQPFGYTIQGSRGRKILTPNEHAPWVPRIYERYNQGVPLKTIAEWLKAECPAARPRRVGGVEQLVPWGWGPTTVGRVLEDPVYVGLLRWQGVIIVGRHQPLVEQGVFDAAQRRRQRQRGRYPGRPNGTGRAKPEPKAGGGCPVCGAPVGTGPVLGEHLRGAGPDHSLAYELWKGFNP